VISLACAQSVEQVLDDKYVPVLPDEVALFSEKNKYLYTIFKRTLQSDKGKAIVRAYEDMSTKKCTIIAIVVLGHS
jgi:hypothetical protein